MELGELSRRLGFDGVFNSVHSIAHKEAGTWYEETPRHGAMKGCFGGNPLLLAPFTFETLIDVLTQWNGMKEPLVS